MDDARSDLAAGAPSPDARDLGVQLYSVRDVLATDVPGTLARLAALGFTHVEPFDLLSNTDALAEALGATGLRAVSAHAPLITGDTAALLDAASRLGIRTVIVPWADPGRFADAAAVRGVAADVDRVARDAARLGLRVGYHNHAFELESILDDGRTALEWLADALPEDVVLEVDIYWAAVGGQDVPALLRRLGERVRFLHVKDGPLDRREGQSPVGQGVVPIRESLAAATALELAVVELDSYDGDMFTALAESVAFLTGSPA